MAGADFSSVIWTVYVRYLDFRRGNYCNRDTEIGIGGVRESAEAAQNDAGTAHPRPRHELTRRATGSTLASGGATDVPQQVAVQRGGQNR
jgi:hypothetical protein